MSQIHQFIGNITIGRVVRWKEIDVFPVFTKKRTNFRLDSLEEGIQKGTLRIREISEAGSIQELLVENSSPSDVLILDGDQLVGAKQNRVALFTIIVTALSKLTIPVSCVEQGRWGWQSREFNSSRHFMYASLRSHKSIAVTDNLMAGVAAESSQGSIWQEISGKASRLETSSPTMAMDDLYSVSEAKASGLLESVGCQPDQIGFLVLIRGGFAGGDMLFCPQLFEKKYRQLLGSYAVDACDSSVEFPRLSVDSILNEVCQCNPFSVSVPGKGENGRFRSDRLSGSAKLLDDEPVYLSFFPILQTDRLSVDRSRCWVWAGFSNRSFQSGCRLSLWIPP